MHVALVAAGLSLGLDLSVTVQIKQMNMMPNGMMLLTLIIHVLHTLGARQKGGAQIMGV